MRELVSPSIDIERISSLCPPIRRKLESRTEDRKKAGREREWIRTHNVGLTASLNELIEPERRAKENFGKREVREAQVAKSNREKGRYGF